MKDSKQFASTLLKIGIISAAYFTGLYLGKQNIIKKLKASNLYNQYQDAVGLPKTDSADVSDFAGCG